MDNKVLYGLSYGLYAVTVQDTEKPTGCIVNTVFQITSEGPIIALSLNHNNYTHGVVAREKKFAVSILSESTPEDVISRLGFLSGKDVDKMDGLSYTLVDDLPILDAHCNGYMICEVVDVAKTATHDVFLAKVVAGERLENLPSMTYSYYRNVIKGTAPKNAPSYQKVEVDSNAEETYVCDVCNHKYVGDIHKEGPDFKCPICKMDVSHFKKVS